MVPVYGLGSYGSCAESAEDVERWLAAEPVSAYPEPLATSTVGMLLVAVVGLTVGGAMLEQARAREATARQETEQQKQIVEDQRRLCVP